MQLDPNHDEVDDLASWHGEISRWDLYLSFSHQRSQVRDIEPENCINSPRLATMVPEIHSTRHRSEKKQKDKYQIQQQFMYHCIL